MAQGAAPVHSIGGDGRAQSESAAWARFVGAADDAEFFRAWLSLLAPGLARLRHAILLVATEDGTVFSPVAQWPNALADLKYLSPVAQQALAQREGVVMSAVAGAQGQDGAALVAYPVELDGRACAVVAADLAAGGQPQATVRQMHWASAWLVDRFRRRSLDATEVDLSRMTLLNELLATALQQRQLRASATAVANELAVRLCCDRVAVGFEEHDRISPLAISHTATFDHRSDLVRALGGAMDEVLDLGVAVTLPRPPGDEFGTIAHEQAAQALGARAMLSVPLSSEARTIGAMTFERHQGPDFTAADQRIANATALMLGPVWALQRQSERPWLHTVREQWRDALSAAVGPRHPGLKLGTAVLGLALLTLALWPAEHRVSARTVIEGSTQLARVAPFDGFIAEALARAGDTVRQGQLMARMEDRDLKLEHSRWSAEFEQAQRKYQVAMAQADRGAMGVLAAQAHQAEAQLALVDEKLARSQLTAPFDGVVVSGDLSQMIGTPVELGRTLFEVAPLTGFRVVLQVDDREIARVAVGQRGTLVLSSLPDRSLPFTVSSVTSVATQQDGRNVFRVEAQVEGSTERLRPGMEGVGKVTVGERSLLWIWTHGFVDWLRLALWSWTP